MNDLLNYNNTINKPHNIILFKNITGSYTFNLNNTFKDVIKVKLIRADAFGDISDWGNKHLIILGIDELNKNYSEKSNNKLNNSFAILDSYQRTDTDVNRLYFSNQYKYHEDIKYFDPPLNSINKLNIKIYDDKNNSNVTTLPLQLKLELLIETKEKNRLY